MIQLLAAKYTKRIAYIFLLLFMGTLCRRAVMPPVEQMGLQETIQYYRKKSRREPQYYKTGLATAKMPVKPVKKEKSGQNTNRGCCSKENIGGPSQPEMSKFKSVRVRRPR